MRAFLRSVDGCGDSVYRGQANADWWVSCSAMRRIVSEPMAVTHSISHLLWGYTTDLLNGAKRHASCPELEDCRTELEVLAQLQHHGAATGLIDFTTEPLVALWFACNEHSVADGAVYILPRSEVHEVDGRPAQQRAAVQYFHKAELRTQQPPYLWCPPGRLRGRPASQASVFVFGLPFIWPKALWKVVISKDSKPTLLEELRTAYNITEDTLFPDFAGYVHMNSNGQALDPGRLTQPWVDLAASAPADDLAERARSYIDCGNAYCEMGRYDQAIEWFTKAISVGPELVVAYLNRSHAKHQLRDIEGALADCDRGIELLEQVRDSFTREEIGAAYWERHLLHSKLDHDKRRITDARRAIQLGVKRYFSPDGRVIPFPGDYLEYRS